VLTVGISLSRYEISFHEKDIYHNMVIFVLFYLISVIENKKKEANQTVGQIK